MGERSAILVVDGNPLARSSAGRMIGSAHPDLVVVEADRFASALDLLEIRRPSVVITDIRLKDGSGLDLSEIIAERFPEVFVVVFTSDDGPEYRNEALKRGADVFVSKTEGGGSVLMEILRRHRSGTGGG